MNTDNIIKSCDKENDENENPRPAKEPPGRLKTAIGTRGANRYKSNLIFLELNTSNHKLLDWEEFAENSSMVERARQSLAWVELFKQFK